MRARTFMLALTILSCASMPRVSVPPLEAPLGAEWLMGEGGVRLHAVIMRPTDEPVAVVVFVVHPEIGSAPLYPQLTAGLLQARFATSVIHPRGSGYSFGLRGDIDEYRLFLADQQQGLDHARARFPTKPVFLMGHSAGAAFALELAAKTKEPLAGLVLVNPAYKLRATEGMAPSLADYFAYAANMVFRPSALTVDMNRRPSAVLHDADRAEGEAMQADPLVVRYFSMRYLLSQNQVMDRCVENARSVHAPLLLLQGEQDLMVDPSGNDEILSAVPTERKVKWVVPGGGHGSSSVETMVEPIVKWLLERVE